MTEYQKQQISWLEWQSQRTGKTIEELREEMSKRGKLGGNPGRPLTKEHKQAISEGRRANKEVKKA